ncbi:MAG: HAD family hydrolase [Rothia sp. (in: high G+C Gram-positive bacteria)]|uniref:HAD-IIB family hydrolase n=1 Tax=Rothia sp. (in: high G+C Gram-positive bacteria) TaxID=1885016 RepID=UPI0026DD2224|nr:HAD family hydrolase [Rothia sp. (in: high G+C Gram-positive bacteria)]MDO4883389.1 HAD family hydrolase [Rothia sp. (in: high G+C Gram-positive bacteria)]
MIRLIASDLDGTLIGPDFRFRPRTLHALQAARAAGIQIVFVTGRPSRWLTPIREQTDFDSYAICSNGAVVFHLGANEIEAINGASAHAIRNAHKLLQPVFPDATYTLETVDTVYIQGPYEGGEVLEGARVVEKHLLSALDGFVGEQVIKYLVRVPGMDPDILQVRVAQTVGELVSVTRGVVGEPLIEMGSKTVNKGRTLAQFAARHGIEAHEVMAFGDMPNDAEMLCWAGRGYAMASGQPALIEKVGRTCPPFGEDGVAQVIEELLQEHGEAQSRAM